MDELALDLHDALVLVDQFVDEGWLDVTSATIVRQLDGLLAAMSRATQEGMWEEDALHKDPRWEEVRELARSFFN